VLTLYNLTTGFLSYILYIELEKLRQIVIVGKLRQRNEGLCEEERYCS